jgi:hypothetical protein
VNCTAVRPPDTARPAAIVRVHTQRHCRDKRLRGPPSGALLSALSPGPRADRAIGQRTAEIQARDEEGHIRQAWYAECEGCRCSGARPPCIRLFAKTGQ